MYMKLRIRILTILLKLNRMKGIQRTPLKATQGVLALFAHIKAATNALCGFSTPATGSWTKKSFFSVILNG
jgi:hypothetical protein